MTTTAKQLYLRNKLTELLHLIENSDIGISDEERESIAIGLGYSLSRLDAYAESKLKRLEVVKGGVAV